MKHGFLISLMVVLLSGCSYFKAAFESFSTDVPEADKVTSIHIQDSWNGLSPIAPYGGQFVLNRDGNKFTGTATFSIGWRGGKPAESQTVELEIPGEVVEEFIEKLSEAEIEEGTYTPKIEHTDDYPDLNIEIVTEKRSMTFYSQSQGEDHSPWGVRVLTDEYVVNSGIPMEALEILKPYLHYDVLETMIDEGLN